MRGQSHITREDQRVLGIVKFFTYRSRWADEVLLLCPCQCWASTNAQQLQTPTLPSPWRAGGACLTGSGPQRRKSQCPVMLCPSNSLVRSKTQNVLSQQECVFLWMSVWEVFSCLFVCLFFQMPMTHLLLALSSTETLLLFYPSRGIVTSLQGNIFVTRWRCLLTQDFFFTNV